MFSDQEMTPFRITIIGNVAYNLRDERRLGMFLPIISSEDRDSIHV